MFCPNPYHHRIHLSPVAILKEMADDLSRRPVKKSNTVLIGSTNTRSLALPDKVTNIPID